MRHVEPQLRNKIGEVINTTKREVITRASHKTRHMTVEGYIALRNTSLPQLHVTNT